MTHAHRFAIALTVLLAVTTSQATCVPAGVDATPTAVVDAQFKAYNAHDVKAFANCYANDVRMSYLDGKYPDIVGRDGILKSFAYLAHAPKGQGVTLVHRIVTVRPSSIRSTWWVCPSARPCPISRRSTKCAMV